MHVPLGRGNLAVAHDVLQYQKIPIVLNEERCKRVAEHVGRDLKPELSGVSQDELREPVPTHCK